jgi:hypothetical protein
VDPIRRDDIERARRASPSEKARQALEMMRLGIALYRAGIRARRPLASEADVDEELHRWLRRDG